MIGMYRSYHEGSQTHDAQYPHQWSNTAASKSLPPRSVKYQEANRKSHWGQPSEMAARRMTDIIFEQREYLERCADRNSYNYMVSTSSLVITCLQSWRTSRHSHIHQTAHVSLVHLYCAFLMSSLAIYPVLFHWSSCICCFHTVSTTGISDCDNYSRLYYKLSKTKVHLFHGLRHPHGKHAPVLNICVNN